MNNMPLTETQQAVLRLLQEMKTCTAVGETLWHKLRGRTRQSYARPAGKVIRGLEKLGLVCQGSKRSLGHTRYNLWRITHEGQKALRDCDAVKAQEKKQR